MNETQNTTNPRLTSKLLILTLLMALSWAATLFVWGVVQDRENRQEVASHDISEQWSQPQVVAGPVIIIPVEKTTVDSTGEKVVATDILTLLPKKLSYENTITSQLLSRGIYTTPVYTATIQGAGAFDLSDITLQPSPDTRIMWDKATVSISISDTRGISSLFDITINNTAYHLLPSSDFFVLEKNGVHTPIALDPNQTHYAFSFELPLKGSREISFLPLGENTTMVMHSNWNTPNFMGNFLPSERTITDDGFTATWNIASYGRNLPQYWIDPSYTTNNAELFSKSFGVGLYQEVTFYTMVDRSIKYAILFISLTFLTFFLYEILVGLRIHPMQYLLVGLAIALFYLLLLSCAEIVGFLPAYLIAALATTLLITGYCFSVLGAKKRAFSIAILLAALYSYLYTLLQMDQYSLLFGSVLLFGVLATVMYITRNLDWYSLTEKNK